MNSSVIILDSSSSDELEFLTENNQRDKIKLVKKSSRILKQSLNNTADVSASLTRGGSSILSLQGNRQIDYNTKPKQIQEEADPVNGTDLTRTVNELPKLSSSPSLSFSTSQLTTTGALPSLDFSTSSMFSPLPLLNNSQRKRVAIQSENPPNTSSKVMQMSSSKVNCANTVLNYLNQQNARQTTFTGETMKTTTRTTFLNSMEIKNNPISSNSTLASPVARIENEIRHTLNKTINSTKQTSNSNLAPVNTITIPPMQFQIDPGITEIHRKSPSTEELLRISLPTQIIASEEKPVRRITPTMLLKPTDKEWIQEKLKRDRKLEKNPIVRDVEDGKTITKSITNLKELKFIDHLVERKRKHLNGVNMLNKSNTSHKEEDAEVDQELSLENDKNIEYKRMKLISSRNIDDKMSQKLTTNRNMGDSDNSSGEIKSKSIHLNGKMHDVKQLTGTNENNYELPTCSGTTVTEDNLSNISNLDTENIKTASETSELNNLQPEYAELLKVCREVEPSEDMEKLINTKLLKYYNEVPPDFVRSKSFCKNVLKAIAMIRTQPDLVYYNLRFILDELKVRRVNVNTIKQQSTVTSGVSGTVNEEKTETSESTELTASLQETKSEDSTISEKNTSSNSTSTANRKTEEQIRKLNKALYILTKRIASLEKSEVNWDDEDSAFLQVGRMKKRACQIYEKICDLTGESKNAHRLMKKPIKFNGTDLPQFNKILQSFINRTQEFPDYSDVYRMLEYCVKTYKLKLDSFEMKRIAENAFTAVGKVLQTRRKRELYESLNYFTDTSKDPAHDDAQLATKLNENQRHHKKINEILDRFVHKQEMPKMVIEDDDKSKPEEDEQEIVLKGGDDCERITATVKEQLPGGEKEQLMTKKKSPVNEEDKGEEAAIIKERNTSLSKGKTKLIEEEDHSKLRIKENSESYKSSTDMVRISIPIASCDKIDDNSIPCPNHNKYNEHISTKKHFNKNTTNYYHPNHANHHCNGAMVDMMRDESNSNQQKSKNNLMEIGKMQPITIDLSESNTNSLISGDTSIMPLSTNMKNVNAIENNSISNLKIVSVTSLNQCWNSTTLAGSNNLDDLFDTHLSNISKSTSRKPSEEIVISDEEL